MESKKRIITREELYHQVWSTPLIHLAKEYGISDVAMGKICKKLNVPKPPVGYWSKLAHGVNVEKTQLPILEEGGLSRYNLEQKSEQEKKQFPEEILSLIVNESENIIKVPRQLVGPDPVILKTQSELSGSSYDRYPGQLHTRSDGCLDIRVTKKTLNRALRIMDTLIKQFKVRGYSIMIRGFDSTYVKIDDLEIKFNLREIYKKEINLNAKRYENQFTYISTGILKLEIIAFGSSIPIRKIFKDKSNLPLEKRLNEFIISLIKIAHLEKVRHWEFEEQQRIKEKEREIVQNKLKEIEEEESKIEDLRKSAKLWKEAEIIREFIQAMQIKKLRNEDWTEWAGNIADWIDPLVVGPKLIIEEKDKYKKQLNPFGYTIRY